jgi:hypothetical protein
VVEGVRTTDASMTDERKGRTTRTDTTMSTAGHAGSSCGGFGQKGEEDVRKGVVAPSSRPGQEPVEAAAKLGCW